MEDDLFSKRISKYFNPHLAVSGEEAAVCCCSGDCAAHSPLRNCSKMNTVGMRHGYDLLIRTDERVHRNVGRPGLS